MSNTGTNINKDVLYIDVDDEITAVIDKVRGSGKKIVALVLPKRATVLQSVVNMKLLKRAADQSKKHIVLITAEAGLLPLAGSIGIHVARSLSSKPEIPDAPQRIDDQPETVEESGGDDEPDVDKTKSVGELAGATAVANELDDTIELEDEDATGATTASLSDKATKGKNRKFKIPNFNKFRVLVVLGAVGIVVLVGGVYAAAVVLPKAKVTIKTDRTALDTSTVVTLKTTPETKIDVEKGIVPAQSQEVKKTLTQQVPATGQINNGEKATGSVKLSLADCSKDQVTVPAGTGVSASGKTFLTKTSATLESVKVGNSCKNADFPSFSTKTVDVTAQTGGSQYNIGPSSFVVAGYSAVSGQSSAAMDGGTDDITKVVTQNDIDSAKQKIVDQDVAPIKLELKNALIGRDLYPMEASFTTATPETKLSAEANAPADDVTVTQTINYTMLGVHEDDLKKVIEQTAKKEIDTKKQSIVDYGLAKAVFSLQAANPDGVAITIETTVVAGADLNQTAIKKQIAGKKAGDAKEIISASPGITDVTVRYSPFWVSAIPKNVNKITLIIEEPQVVSRNVNDNP